MTATGIPSPASRTDSSTLSGVAPPPPPAPAPPASSPRSTSASNPGAPPVTYGTNARPPPSIRARSADSTLGTRHRPERPADGVEVLVPTAGQVHEHEPAPCP